MSKPMRRSKPASRPVSAMPTTPPAGPERIASLPWNSSAAVSPPDDIMNMRRVLALDPLGEGRRERRVGATHPAALAPPPPSRGGDELPALVQLRRHLRHVPRRIGER